MATVEEQVVSTISSQALSMLRCFASGMDDVIYGMAQDIAKQRCGNLDLDPGPIQIDAEDVLLAAEYLAEQIKTLVKEGKVPSTISEQIDGMVDCCKKHSHG